MRERSQCGGWRGGGALSCAQREAERGVGKREVGGGAVGAGAEGGKRESRYGVVAAWTSAVESRVSKERGGCGGC